MFPHLLFLVVKCAEKQVFNLLIGLKHDCQEAMSHSGKDLLVKEEAEAEGKVFFSC